MKPLSCLGVAAARGLRGLLFDLDDTFLDHGVLGEQAYGALGRWRAAGLAAVAVTGRPSGWGEVLIRQWPIAAVVAENGALAWHRVDGYPELLDWVSPEVRGERLARLARIVATLQREFPLLRASDDTHHRTTDFTFDIGERQRVAPDVCVRVRGRAAELGARATQSSVHLHISCDPESKASGALRLLARKFDEDTTAARFRYAYIGDSENDASCFAAFGTSIGVSNVRGRFSLPPSFVTSAERGRGFAEAVDALLERRKA